MKKRYLRGNLSLRFARRALVILTLVKSHGERDTVPELHKPIWDSILKNHSKI